MPQNLTLRNLLYHDTHHLELMRRVLFTWNCVNFAREKGQGSPEQGDISRKQVEEMVIENVTGYRRLFSASDRYWPIAHELRYSYQADSSLIPA